MKTAIGGALLLVTAACAQPAPPVEGVLVVGPGVQSFRPCHEPRTLWLTGDSALLASLAAAHDSVADVAYQPVLALLRGVGRAETPAVVAGNFDGSFRVDSLLAVSASLPPRCGPDPDAHLEPPV